MLGVMNLLLDLFLFLCNGHMGFRGASPTASIICVWHFIANFLTEAFPISGNWIGLGNPRKKQSKIQFRERGIRCGQVEDDFEMEEPISENLPTTSIAQTAGWSALTTDGNFGII